MNNLLPSCAVSPPASIICPAWLKEPCSVLMICCCELGTMATLSVWFCSADKCWSNCCWLGSCIYYIRKHITIISLVTRKPVFRVFDQVRLKLVCLSTEASLRNAIANIETRDIILSRYRTTKALIRLICAFVVRILHKQVFS